MVMKIKNTVEGALISPAVAAEIEAILFDITFLREELTKLKQDVTDIKILIDSKDISPVLGS